MKILRIHIDGYGRLLDREMAFEPGFQVILGPNEQGKSTVRAFIADMLYGQKRSAAQRVYDEVNELRCPWTDPDKYGGRLIYQLDDGRVIEVYRRFDRKNEQVAIFDQTHGREITGEFEQLRNREPNFAPVHLGISKEIFTNTVTIGHLGLDGLGDDAALAQIREKLLALADSGEETSSADAAIKRIESRIATIGPPASRTRPLPTARARWAALEQERAAAAALRADLDEMERRRRDIMQEIAQLRDTVADLDKQLDAIARMERAQRLRQAEELEMQIGELTRKCFALREAAQFPLEQRHDFQRTEMLLTTAENTLRRMQQEREQRESAAGKATAKTAATGGDIPEQLDQQLTDMDERLKAIRARMDQAAAAKAAAETRLAAAEQELAALPDFNRIADDPVTWLSQLGSSFRVAVRFRDEECEKRRVLREKLERQRESLAEPERIFGSAPDFESAVREYEIGKRMREEQAAQLEQSMESLQATAQEWAARLPGFAWLAALTAVILTGLIAASVMLSNNGILVAAGMTGLAMVYFIGKAVYGRIQRARALKQLDEAESRIVTLHSENEPQSVSIESMMLAAQCQTVRELEAKYDYYRKAKMELETSLEVAGEIEQKAGDAEKRVAQLFAMYQKMFASAGETLTTEADVEPAASRAAARYQSYRDAKRRVAENRDLVKRHEAELAAIEIEFNACRDESVQLDLEARRLMREHGYTDENKHDTAVGALRSYRIRTAQLREKKRAIADTLSELDRNIEAEEQTVRQYREQLAKFLAAARVETVEQWHERAKQAELYRDVRQKLDACTNTQAAVLQGQDLRVLRATVAAGGPADNVPESPPEEIKNRRAEAAARIDTLTREEHALHVALAEKQAGSRTLCEIEEERAAVERQMHDLELELTAASYAKALIEEIARDKHSRIAPRLTAQAGEYLGFITGGRYTELTVSRDLRIGVRVPQTQRMHEDPERVLSKGTTDQIYLALRLAMVQCIGEKGESLPVVLDDPFPNYDDERLNRAIQLLARIGQSTQVLLFTCRDDVVDAARAAGAPVTAL